MNTAANSTVPITIGRSRWRIAFHAWTPPRVGYDDGGTRSLWIERLAFEDGRPVIK